MNAFELVRIVFSVTLIMLSIWGLFVVKDGLYAFQISIRSPMLNRRRFLMWMFLSWGIALGLQGFIGAISYDLRPYNDPVFQITNWLYLYILVTMIITAIHQLGGWMRFQDIVGNKSLVDERVQEMAVEGRQICHNIANEMHGLVQGLEIIRASGDIPEHIKHDVESAYKQAVVLIENTTAVHKLVREMGNVGNSHHNYP